MSDILVIPIAGFGQRFRNEGYPKPKQQLEIDEELSCLEESLASVELNGFRVIFILRRYQLENEGFSEFLKRLGIEFEVVVIESPTRGSVETCLSIEKVVDAGDRLFIFTMDVAFRPRLTSETFPVDWDGGVLTFKSNSSNYSYVSIDNGFVTKAAEKVPISDDAVVGVYYYARADSFFEHAKSMIRNDETTNGEFYLSPMFNNMIENGLKVGAIRAESFYVFGTPKEYEFHRRFARNSLRGRMPRVGLASDHSGFHMKSQLSAALTEMGIQWQDFGTYSDKATDYTDHVSSAVDALNRGDVDYVFASCRSGQGALLAGNSEPGVLGVLVFDSSAAEYGVRHNAANFFSFPERVWLGNDALDATLRTIFASVFEGGRHQLRLMKVLERKGRENS